MTELKTLKDLPRLQLSSRRDELIQELVGDADCVCSKILKQEAIKWVKYYYEEREKAFDHDRWKWINQGRISELMDFFNITEEELK